MAHSSFWRPAHQSRGSFLGRFRAYCQKATHRCVGSAGFVPDFPFTRPFNEMKGQNLKSMLVIAKILVLCKGEMRLPIESSAKRYCEREPSRCYLLSCSDLYPFLFSPRRGLIRIGKSLIVSRVQDRRSHKRFVIQEGDTCEREKSA